MNDLMEVQRQLKAMIIKTAVIFIAFLVLSLVVANSVSNKLGMWILTAGVCLDIFIWGMYGTPVWIYRKFLNDLLTGRSRKVKGLVKKVGTEPVYKDNKLFYYEILIDDEEGVERMLLVDANKPLPPLMEGRVYEFEVYENFIKSVVDEL